MKALLTASVVLLTAAAAQAATTDTKGSMADATVSANVMAANDGEIMAGKLAETKATNKDVKAFAKHMVDEHTKNNSQVDAVGKKINVTPKPDEKVAAMKADTKQKIDALAQKSGADFDKSYMDLQVAMHEQVLSDINGKLLPTAQNAELKSLLTATKGHVEQHLAMAKKIQTSLK